MHSMKNLLLVSILTLLAAVPVLAQPAPVSLFTGTVAAATTTNLATPGVIRVPYGKACALQITQTHAAAQTLVATTATFDVSIDGKTYTTGGPITATCAGSSNAVVSVYTLLSTNSAWVDKAYSVRLTSVANGQSNAATAVAISARIFP
jgi:hypothetical protein